MGHTGAQIYLLCALAAVRKPLVKVVYIGGYCPKRLQWWSYWRRAV